MAPGVEQPQNVAQWLAVLREAAPAAKNKAKAACRLREFSGKQSPGWPESPQGRDVAAALGRYQKSLRRPCSGRFIKEQLAHMQPKVHETNENVKKLVALQEGKADKQLQLKDRQLQLQRARKERADARRWQQRERWAMRVAEVEARAAVACECGRMWQLVAERRKRKCLTWAAWEKKQAAYSIWERERHAQTMRRELGSDSDD